jgi:iron complex transport system substrate-binding protein
MRICSFLPSATEIVYALGLGDQLYGVSHECDYPPEARKVTRIVSSVFDDRHYSSAEIDGIIAERLAEGKGIYEIDGEAVRAIEPDLLLSQELCGE